MPRRSTPQMDGPSGGRWKDTTKKRCLRCRTATYTFPKANTYTITYRWVPGTEVPEDVSLPAQQSDNENSSGAKPEFSIQTVESSDKKWHFDGWYTKSEIAETDQPFSSTEYSFEGTDEKNLTLYGKWSHKDCTVTFHADYGQPALGHFSDDPYSVSYTVPYGSKLTKEVPAPAPYNTATYYFEGWKDNIKDPNSGTFYPSRAISTMTVKRDLSFVAHWAKNATVTFKIVNGYWSGETAEDRNVTVVLYPQADGAVGGTLPASSVPAIMIPAAGYENAAGSWDAVPNIEPNGIVDSVTYTYTFGQTHSGGSTSTKLTLHYESNGGTSYRDERYSSGTIVNLDKIPIRGGYTFSGWYADAGLTAPITNVRMTENKTVYAGWEATAVPDMLDGTGHWAEKSIERAAALGWIAGYADDTFRPNHYITRAEAMTMINRVLCRVPETEGDLLPGMITWPDNQPGT